MPGFIQPGRGDVHVNRPLTNISLAFMQDQTKFVADRVFPNVPVAKQSDLYFTYDRGEFNRDEMQKRAPGAESAGGVYTLGEDNYFAHVWAFHKDVDDQVRGNADAPLNPDMEATEFVTTKALLKREKEWVASYFAPSIWTTDTTPSTLWDVATSTPIEDVRAAKRAVAASTGFEPNIFVAAREVYDTLLDHGDIVGRLDRGQTPGGPAMTNRQQLAALLEVEEVLVMNAIENTAPKGSAATHSFIGGSDDALLAYRAPNPGLMIPSGGYTFSWTGYTGATQMGTRIKRMRIDTRNSDRIEIEQAFVQKLVAADLGVFFEDVLTPG